MDKQTFYKCQIAAGKRQQNQQCQNNGHTEHDQQFILRLLLNYHQNDITSQHARNSDMAILTFFDSNLNLFLLCAEKYVKKWQFLPVVIPAEYLQSQGKTTGIHVRGSIRTVPSFTGRSPVKERN